MWAICAVWVILATLVVTERSCFNHWRQTDARHQLKPFHLLPNNVTILIGEREKKKVVARWHRATYWSFNLKVPHEALRISPLPCVTFEGPTDFFFRIQHDWEIKKTNFSCMIYVVARKKRPAYDLHVLTLLLHLPDPPLFDTFTRGLQQFQLFFFFSPVFLWMRCKYDDVTDATFSWSYGGAQLF